MQLFAQSWPVEFHPNPFKNRSPKVLAMANPKAREREAVLMRFTVRPKSQITCLFFLLASSKLEFDLVSSASSLSWLSLTFRRLAFVSRTACDNAAHKNTSKSQTNPSLACFLIRSASPPCYFPPSSVVTSSQVASSASKSSP